MGLLSKFKKGGGFLHNVDGVIVDYKVTDDPDFGGEAPARKEGAFVPLWVELTVRQDGSDTPDTTHLFAGDSADFIISEDGHTLEPVEGASFWGSTAFARFYESLVEHGLPDVDIEDGAPITFEHMINWRVRFVQVKDEEAMARAAKNAAKSKGKINAAGQRKGKDGKYYDIRTLEVSAVYGEADATPVGKPPTARRGRYGSRLAEAEATVQSERRQAAASTSGLAAFAEETLLAILGDAKNNTLSKTDLNLAITRRLIKDARREDVRRYLYDDANLEALAADGTITYKKSGKAQTISLVE